MYVKQEKQRWNKADIYRHRIVFIQRKNPSWVLTFTDFLPRRPSRTILSLRVSLRAPRERLFCWVNHYSLPPWHPLFHSPVSSYSLGSFFFTLEWKLWSSKALYLLIKKKKRKKKRGVGSCWMRNIWYAEYEHKYTPTGAWNTEKGLTLATTLDCHAWNSNELLPYGKSFLFFEEMVLMASSNFIQLVRY